MSTKPPRNRPEATSQSRANALAVIVTALRWSGLVDQSESDLAVAFIVNAMPVGQPLEHLVIQVVVDQGRARGIELAHGPQVFGFGHCTYKNAATGRALRGACTACGQIACQHGALNA